MADLRPPSDGDWDYDQFFGDSLPAVMGLARRLTSSELRAEDVAIEALGRAYAHWDRVRTMAHARAWVLRVATNIVIDEARKKRPILPPGTVAPDVSDGVSLRVDLMAMILKLPRRQREAVALRYLADMPEAEVAVAMGVTPGSVKKHLSRGLAAMRSALGQDIDLGGNLGFQ